MGVQQLREDMLDSIYDALTSIEDTQIYHNAYFNNSTDKPKKENGTDIYLQLEDIKTELHKMTVFLK